MSTYHVSYYMSVSNSLKEYWAKPGVVEILTCLFRSGRHCFIKYDFTGKSSTAIESSWINSSPTPNLSIKKSLHCVFLIFTVWFWGCHTTIYLLRTGRAIFFSKVYRKAVIAVGSLSFKSCKFRPNNSTKCSALCTWVLNCFNFLFWACLVLRSGIPAPLWIPRFSFSKLSLLRSPHFSKQQPTQFFGLLFSVFMIPFPV